MMTHRARIIGLALALVGVAVCGLKSEHLDTENKFLSSQKEVETFLLLQDGIYWPKLATGKEAEVELLRGNSSSARRPRRHNHHQHHHHNQGNQQNYKTTYACEGNQMELNCQEGKLIHLVRANYGRFSLTICNELGHSNYSVMCASFRAFLFMENSQSDSRFFIRQKFVLATRGRNLIEQAIRSPRNSMPTKVHEGQHSNNRCNKLSNCSVTVSKELFGDPCEGTSKYLEVQYFCDDATTQVNNGTTAGHNRHTSPVISNPNNRTAAPSTSHKSPPMSSSGGESVQQQASSTMTRTTSGVHNNIVATNSGVDNFDMTSRTPLPVIPMQQQQQQQQLQQFCPPQISSRNLYWNATRAGQVARQPCPEGASGRVAWTCDFERLRFSPPLGPDLTQCRSNWLARLSAQLDQLLESPLINNGGGNSGNSREILNNQDEQMIKSILGELSLMAKTKELFSEDLKRIDVMLSQMIAQLRSLSVLFGSQTSASSASATSRNEDEPWASAQHLRNPSLVSMHEELFQKLVAIISSLFDMSQRNAWLELPNSEARKRLETRLLAHLKDSGLMLAQSLPVDQLADMVPVRQANIYAGISVITTSSSASTTSSSNSDGTTGELNLQTSTSSKSSAYLNRLFGDQDEQLQAQQQVASSNTEWRLQVTLLKELAGNGINKFLILDVKKPDFSLIRQQLEIQQQQQQQVNGLVQSNGEQQLANNNNNNNNNNFLVSAADNTNQQAFSLAGDQQTQYQSRIFGIFPVIGDTGELVVDLDTTTSTAKPELSRLAELLTKWPISVEFKMSPQSQVTATTTTTSTSSTMSSINSPAMAYLANQRAAYCQSLSDNTQPIDLSPALMSATNRCHLSRYNATNFVCSCDKFGFLLLGQQFPIGATGPLGPMVQNDGLFSSWPPPPSTYDNSDTTGPLMGSADSTTTSRTSYDSYVVNKNQQQQQQQQQSIGIFAGILIVLGVALLILTIGGLVVSLSFRWLSKRTNSGQKNNKSNYFVDGTTTGPLTDHNLMGSDPLVSSAATTHSASIIGLNGHVYGSAAPPVVVGYKPQQLYSAHQQTGPMMEAYASSNRTSGAAWPLRALNWILQRPVEWLSDQLTGSGNAAHHNQEHHHQFSSGKSADHMSIQHRLIANNNSQGTLGGGAGTLGYQQAAHHHQQHHQKSSNQYQNGFTTSLGLHNQRAQISSTGSQSAVPLNASSSNSSYVSSSAYYEEIGPGALTKVSTSHTIVDPFKRPQMQHMHDQQQQQQFHQQQQQQQQQWQPHTHMISYSMEPTIQQQQQQQQMSLISKQHLHNDLSPLQSTSSSSTSSAAAVAANLQGSGTATTPRHYLFASPSAVNAYKQQQQQFRATGTSNGFHHHANID